MIKTHLFAALVTLLVPVGIAALILWQVPSACAIRTDPAIYRWTCLVPSMTLVTGSVAAVLLPLIFAVFRRAPRHPLALALGVGLLTQAVFWIAALTSFDRGEAGRFALEALFLPQPFVAGAIAGAIYGLALRSGLVR